MSILKAKVDEISVKVFGLVLLAIYAFRLWQTRYSLCHLKPRALANSIADESDDTAAKKVEERDDIKEVRRRKFEPSCSEIISHCSNQQMNANRQCMIALARPYDHLGYVHMELDPNFDVDRTIFTSISNPVRRKLMKVKLGHIAHWSEQQLARIQKLYWERIRLVAPTRPAFGKLDAILDFMSSECNFKMEHADGSFLDHLEFCRDYSAIHYPSQSARVLFLHSICGVGTNCFPMSKEKMPKLEALLDAKEFKHVESFPTILRLCKGTEFLNELYTDCMSGTPKIVGVEYYRVLDGKKLTMRIDDLWVHLNFHLIHSLDFLPICGWRAYSNDMFLQEFICFYTLLEHCGKREANVNLPKECVITRTKQEAEAAVVAVRRKKSDGKGDTFLLHLDDSATLDKNLSCDSKGMFQGLPSGSLDMLLRAIPRSVLKKMTTKQIRQWSAEANVSLEYRWLSKKEE